MTKQKMSKFDDYTDFEGFLKDKRIRVYFNNPLGLTQGAIYTIDYWNEGRIGFKGYNRTFKPNELKFKEIS